MAGRRGQAACEPSADQEWLRRFVIDMGPAALQTARSMGANVQDAEDAVMTAMEGFVGAFAQNSSHGPRHPRAYLMQSVRNAAIGIHRRRRAVPVEAPLDDRVPSDVATPQQCAELMVECGAIGRAFEGLKFEHRECLRLIDEFGGDMAAVGRAMQPQMTAGAVRVRALRARRALVLLYIEEIVGPPLSGDCTKVLRKMASSDDLTAAQEEHLASCVRCSAAEEELACQGVRRTAPPRTTDAG